MEVKYFDKIVENVAISKSREDYFQFGGTVKAYFCNNPIKIKKWESGTPVKRSSSNRSDRLNKSKNNDFKRFPNDERFYLPKPQSNHTEVAVTRGSKIRDFLIFFIRGVFL